MSTLAIIPARYASTRLPGKPLASVGGFPMVEWVYRRARLALGRAVVATDDSRIYDAVQAFGGEAMLTSPSHQSGTDRCAEVLLQLRDEGYWPQVVVNVQGDEPFVSIAYLRKLAALFTEEQVRIATLVRPFAPSEDVANPNWPKVVVDLEENALLFSRSPIPFIRNGGTVQTLPYLKHVGIYAFRPETLLEVARLPHDRLEQIEGLEQLRWLRNQYAIRTLCVDGEGISVDTPEDLAHADSYAKAHRASLWVD